MWTTYSVQPTKWNCVALVGRAGFGFCTAGSGYYRTQPQISEAKEAPQTSPAERHNLGDLPCCPHYSHSQWSSFPGEKIRSHCRDLPNWMQGRTRVRPVCSSAWWRRTPEVRVYTVAVGRDVTSVRTGSKVLLIRETRLTSLLLKGGGDKHAISVNLRSSTNHTPDSWSYTYRRCISILSWT